MKKIGTITFHHAQNYGSVLQTYALQTFVQDLAQSANVDIQYNVIDVMPKCQTTLYSIYKKGGGITNCIKNTVAFFNYKKLLARQEKFKDFLDNQLQLTSFCPDEQSLIEMGKTMDYCISGSDQIWNVRSQDFEDYYYLNFAENARKISYAASFGPLKIDWEKYDKEKYAELLREYSAVSVREKGSAENVNILIGKEPEIHVDPTLLLDKEEWQKIQSNANYKKGQYIFMYCLEPSKAQLKLIKAISKKLKLPVVITRYNNKNDIINGFVKKYETGPRDFLSLIDNAAMVVTSSFHGTAFSLIYRKKFYVLNGRIDNRISDILSKTGLLDRSLEGMEDLDKVNFNEVNFAATNKFLLEQKAKTSSYLKSALEILEE